MLWCQEIEEKKTLGYLLFRKIITTAKYPRRKRGKEKKEGRNV